MNFSDLLTEYNKEIKNFFKFKTKLEIKEQSQYFTPEIVVDKMLENLEIIEKKKIEILDPACGCGILVIKLIEKICNKMIPEIINIWMFDIDKNAILILEEITKKVKIKGLSITFNLINEDYLKYKIEKKFDYIIANPPYKKIKAINTPPEFSHILNGQPNLYHLFIAKSLDLIAINGTFIILSPKNYLSGKYTEKLRHYILKNFAITRIHTFSERSRIFQDEILQEICILQIRNKKQEDILLSYNGNLKFKTDIKSILLDESKKIILTPRTEEELERIKKFKIFQHKTIGREIFIKVGKVVQFRVYNKKEALKETHFDEFKDGIPLIVYRHINRREFSYRTIIEKNNNRSITIIDDGNQKSIFNKNSNYVLVKKSIEKKNEKLIYSVPYLKYLLSTKIAIDNGLSYFTNKNDDLSEVKVLGIHCILNSKQFDEYYRMLNSSHTINNYELEAMCFPNLSQIEIIGEMCLNKELSVVYCTEVMEKYFEMNNCNF